MENTTVTESAKSFFSLDDGLPKVILFVTPCVLCLYVNVIMLFTLRSKETFCETPRYILFSSLLFSDSVQLSFTLASWFLNEGIYDLDKLGIAIGYACFLVYLICRVINIISPLYLGLSSLERYIAICFPLRHAQIVDKRRTIVSIVVVWILSIIFWTAEVTATLMFEVRTPRSCTDFIIFQMRISLRLNTAVTATVFTVVSVVIIYTYINVLIVAKSSTSEKASANKAHKTILLHMLQFCLYLLSILFGPIRRVIAVSGMKPENQGHLNFVLFLMFNLLPRCLSPLVYGLRDKAFFSHFKYYFLFRTKSTVQPLTSVKE